MEKKTGDSHGNRYGVGKKYAPRAREDPRSKIKSPFPSRAEKIALMGGEDRGNRKQEIVKGN